MTRDRGTMKCMHHRTKLPRRLGERFSIADAEAVGVRPGRHGRTTAARLWGLPLPTRWKEGEEIDVVVPTGTTPPKTSRVRGSRLKTERAVTRILKGVPVVDAVAALFMCAPDLTVDQATLSEIEVRLAMWRQFPGQRTIQQALPSARVGVESPKETETRLLIIDSGLPEPVVQFEVRVEGELIARPDLAYPELKIGIEYDGDGHRTDKDEWRRDIQRHRALTAAGWMSLHLTEADLVAGARDAFAAQLRRAMAERRMEITAQTASRP